MGPIPSACSVRSRVDARDRRCTHVQLSIRDALLAAALTAAATVFSSQATAQRGVVVGVVTDSASRTPLPDVQVRAVGTAFVTLTRADGTYRLPGLTAGRVTLRALRLGMRAVTHNVTMPDSGTVTVDFMLSPSAATLDQVVVQATGETERQRETGNSVQLITPDSVPQGAVASLSDVLSSRAPGVTVTQQSGETGGTSRIRIRGNNSVSLDNGPLLVIDGVRADNDQSASQLDVGGQAPSRLDDLDPNEIDDITVLRGPAAAALYGTAGANGVIQVTTKHGSAGKPVWRTYGEYGSVRNYVHYPANYARIGLDAAGNRVTQCTLLLQAGGGCTPFADSLVSFNPLATLSPNVPGWRADFGLQASGGTDAINYYASADHKDEHGVYTNNYVNRTNARANLHATLSPVVDLSANIGYLQSGLGLPQNDNASYGVLSGGLLGSAFNDPITHGYSAGLTPDSLAQVLSTQSVNRYTGSATATWRPLKWLSVVGVTGLDFTQTTERQFFPIGVSPIYPTGRVETDPITDRQYTTNLTATARYEVVSSVQGTTSIGTQYTDKTHNQLIAIGQGLLPGATTLAGANTSFSITEDNPEEVLFGGLVQQQLAWRDKVFLSGAVRTDKNSALNGSWTTYPEASLSWVIGEEPFFPHVPALSSLRLRSAFGESGERPQFRQPLFFFSAAPAKKDAQELIGAIDTATGNGNLTPEISREFEAGFDAGFLSERLTVQVTYYNKTTSGSLIQRQLAPGTGGNVQFVNLGEVTNKGLEFGLTGTLFDSRQFTAELTFNGSINHNKLVKLGPNISPVTFDAGDAGDTQAFTPGYSLGGYWSFPYTYKDLNHDGIIEPNEITVGSTPVFFGNSQPSDEYSITPAVTLFRLLRLSALFDRRAGVMVYNGTEEFRCGFANTICQEAYDPKVGLKRQAAAITESLSLSDAGSFEDGSFWKLREVTARISAPTSWARRIHASQVSFSLSGRNLVTWTKYSGFDPEINFAPNVNNQYNPFTASDFLTQPPVRYWTGRLDITW
jgi:TonB-dependent starch-binding outer membrane protein SusC